MTKEGGAGREFFILVDGTANVTKGSRRVNQLGPGDFFGEMAVLDDRPRSASATAETDSQVYFILREDMVKILARSPQLAG